MKKRSGDDSRCLESEMMVQKPPLGTPLDWENPLNEGCLMHLAMNEGHGDKVQDLSLNGNHGTLHNFAFPPTVTSGWNPGQTGVGLNFNGTGDYINCGHNTSLDFGTGDYSFSLWLKRERVGVTEVVIDKRTSEHVGFALWISTDNKIQFRGDGSGHDVKSDVVLTDAVWYFISLTNRRGGDRVLTINETSKTSAYNSSGLNITNSNDLRIGVDGSATYPTRCSIDQARIQSRAWSAKEVKDYAINPWQVYLQP